MNQSIFRLNLGDSSCVEKGQIRIGPAGMIQVLSPMGSIRDEKIHYGSLENPIIFGVTIVFSKDKENKDRYKAPEISERWQYHTVESIEEHWPTVLPKDWLEQLVQQQSIILQG